MPRPCKRRRVCALPGCRRFGDLEGDQHQEPIEMAVDEFEAIRLVDLLDLTQEEAARQMEQRYNLGAATVVDYNTALDALVEAQVQLLQAKYEYIFKTEIIKFYLDSNKK